MGLQELSFISDHNLEQAVSLVILAAEKRLKAAEKELFKNTIDPFSALFDSLIQDISFEEWIKQEKARQSQKTMQNEIGNFHQNVLGFMDGWTNLNVGNNLDLRNDTRKIIAEIKNKHNTMNSSSSLAVYDKMSKQLDWDPSCAGYTAYCVIIVPKAKKVFNMPFAPSERGVSKKSREDVRLIDGKSFYTLATGDSDAMRKIFDKLPLIINNSLKRTMISLKDVSYYTDLFEKVYG